jgi:metal-sulfur cluster biosynthetic enzyme
MATKDQILDLLRKVYDPEIPVNLVDLGLIYDIEIDGSKVHVNMTLTATGCPMHSVITKNVKDAIEELGDVSEASVEIVWEPRWSPERISDLGRQALGMK